MNETAKENDTALGRRPKAARVAGEVTGASVPWRVWKDFRGVTGGAKARTLGLIGTIVGGSSGVAVDNGSLAAADRYTRSCIANGVTAESEVAMLASAYRQFWLYAVLVLASVLGGLWSLFVSPPISYGVLFFFTRFMATPFLAAFAIRAGHLNWVVRRRSLDGLSPYLRSGSRIFPTKHFE